MGNFLLGFSLGLGFGMLFAPKPGSETRDYLGSKASEGTDYLRQQGQQLKDSASDLLERGKSAVMSQKDRIVSQGAGNLQNAGQQG
jgi:gas vesicle protein